MSHENVIRALNHLNKKGITAIAPSDHAKHLHGENDRVFIILHGATLEDILREHLDALFKGLNKDERTRLFDYNGPAGTFSSRLMLAQGLGLIDRNQRHKCEIVKAMRNVAAHCHTKISFDTPVIRDAVLHLIPSQIRGKVKGWEASEYRHAFGLICLASCGPATPAFNPEINFTNLVRTLNEMREKRKTDEAMHR